MRLAGLHAQNGTASLFKLSTALCFTYKCIIYNLIWWNTYNIYVYMYPIIQVCFVTQVAIARLSQSRWSNPAWEWHWTAPDPTQPSVCAVYESTRLAITLYDTSSVMLTVFGKVRCLTLIKWTWYFITPCLRRCLSVLLNNCSSAGIVSYIYIYTYIYDIWNPNLVQYSVCKPSLCLPMPSYLTSLMYIHGSDHCYRLRHFTLTYQGILRFSFNLRILKWKG